MAQHRELELLGFIPGRDFVIVRHRVTRQDRIISGAVMDGAGLDAAWERGVLLALVEDLLAAADAPTVALHLVADDECIEASA